MTLRYQIEHLVRRFRPSRSRQAVDVLRVPHLEVAAGEVLAVIGPNGSGKSTLLETMAFLAKPDEGRILLDGRDVWGAGESLAARRRCPMLLQRTVLFKTSVLKNVMYGLRARGVNRAKARIRAEHVLRLVGLEKLADRTHRELSGGERQRVALARILAIEPGTLLLDEPTAHVDHANAQLIEAIIRDLHVSTGMTVILTSHDFRQARSLANRVVTLLDGQLFLGPLDNLFTGTLRRSNDGFTFHGETGLFLSLKAQAILQEEGDCPADSLAGHVRISLDPDRMEIIAKEEETPSPLDGTIEAIEQQEDRCRLAIRLETGHRLCAALPRAEYARLALNIGRRVNLRIRDQAVCVARTPP